MGNFKKEAEDYQPTKVKNISDLSRVDVDNVVLTETKSRDDVARDSEFFCRKLK